MCNLVNKETLSWLRNHAVFALKYFCHCCTKSIEILPRILFLFFLIFDDFSLYILIFFYEIEKHIKAPQNRVTYNALGLLTINLHRN